MNNISENNTRTVAEELFSSQKLITLKYNDFVNECTTPKIRVEVQNVLNDEFEIGAEIYSEIKSRGWCSELTAKQEDIDTVKEEFKKTTP